MIPLQHACSIRSTREKARILTGIALAFLGTFNFGAVVFLQFRALMIEVASLK
jgi:hypothetical protein